ncbi:DUF202 domain-containing protein [Brenneria uluponensis]|uniref:DUF202 domain-containing protein n=1 Tax=Brenneria uluponensis TaxID=3057057 RepID=UPI0028E5C743|nr:DUF202 domain-containing protein [Brenneria ulupoensis]
MVNNLTAPRDPGLQPERTGLAWSRTAFLMLVNSVLLLKAGSMKNQMVMLVAGILLLLVTLVMYIWSALRLRFILHTNHPCSGLTIHMARFFTLAIVATALLVALLNIIHLITMA